MAAAMDANASAPTPRRPEHWPPTIMAKIPCDAGSDCDSASDCNSESDCGDDEAPLCIPVHAFYPAAHPSFPTECTSPVYQGTPGPLSPLRTPAAFFRSKSVADGSGNTAYKPQCQQHFAVARAASWKEHRSPAPRPSARAMKKADSCPAARLSCAGDFPEHADPYAARTRHSSRMRDVAAAPEIPPRDAVLLPLPPALISFPSSQKGKSTSSPQYHRSPKAPAFLTPPRGPPLHATCSGPTGAPPRAQEDGASYTFPLMQSRPVVSGAGPSLAQPVGNQQGNHEGVVSPRWLHVASPRQPSPGKAHLWAQVQPSPCAAHHQGARDLDVSQRMSPEKLPGPGDADKTSAWCPSAPQKAPSFNTVPRVSIALPPAEQGLPREEAFQSPQGKSGSNDKSSSPAWIPVAKAVTVMEQHLHSQDFCRSSSISRNGVQAFRSFSEQATGCRSPSLGARSFQERGPESITSATDERAIAGSTSKWLCANHGNHVLASTSHRAVRTRGEQSISLEGISPSSGASQAKPQKKVTFNEFVFVKTVRRSERPRSKEAH